MIYFIAFVIVLGFLAFIIREASAHDKKPLQQPEDQNRPEEEKRHYELPLIK